jgi:hypothetical protein
VGMTLRVAASGPSSNDAFSRKFRPDWPIQRLSSSVGECHLRRLKNNYMIISWVTTVIMAGLSLRAFTS